MKKKENNPYLTSFVPYNSFFIDHYQSHQKHDMKIQHYHDTYEIYLQTQGERYLFLNDICHTLKTGDLYILRPFEIHYTESRDASHYGRYLLNFNDNKLDIILSNTERHFLLQKLVTGIYHLEEKSFQIIFNLFKNIEYTGKKTGLLAEKLQYCAVFQLLIELSAMIQEDMMPETALSVSNVRPEIINAIHYLNKHYQEEITLEQVAETVHMSKYHFCRMFHKVTGATFLQYLNNIRLTKVHQLLLQTDLSLADIAIKTGFASTAHLSRIFKSVYYVSPRNFRKGIPLHR